MVQVTGTYTREPTDRGRRVALALTSLLQRHHSSVTGRQYGWEDWEDWEEWVEWVLCHCLQHADM